MKVKLRIDSQVSEDSVSIKSHCGASGVSCAVSADGAERVVVMRAGFVFCNPLIAKGLLPIR